ncbi:hypothetical protein [Mucilaginibacter sp. HD30]
MKKEKKSDNNIKCDGHVTVVKHMKNYANDPTFLKQLERAKAMVSKIDFSKLPK